MTEKGSPPKGSKATYNRKLRKALIFHKQKKYSAQVIARLVLRNKLEEFLKEPISNLGVREDDEEDGGTTDGHNHAEAFAEWDNSTNDDDEAEK